MAAGLEHDDGRARFDLRAEHGEDFLQVRLRPVQHAEVVVRPATAQAFLRQLDARAGGLKHARGRQRALRPEIIREGVGKQHHRVAAPHAAFARRAAPGALQRIELGAETARRELRQGPFDRNPGNHFERRRKNRRARHGIHQARRFHRERRPLADPPHRVRMQGTRVRFVVVREKFRLVARHVGVRGAVAAAALAGEAPRERVLHLLAAPARGDHLAAQHLVEQAAAAARGVALFLGGAVARAHGAALGRAALAHADAALGGAQETVALAAHEGHARGGRHGPVSGPLAQVLVHAVDLAQRVHQLARIHASERIPGALEFAEGGHELRPVHERQEFGAALAVAMLARERAAIGDHQLGGLAQEVAPARDALRRAQLEVDARVDAAVAEMAVQRGAVAVAVDQLLELAQVVAEAHGIHRRVLPADHRVGPVVGLELERGGRGAGLADRPDAIDEGAIRNQCALEFTFKSFG